ncbi:hypothetical protein Ddye_001817 [Dipteronia dyeriana]|uniref:Reverse transcriptase n=1 Tax=Dipteronia dyeriana TaxID=168575 RepID=A0AAD9XPX7_9ROSI|nr:hypothetical protein Ddye_001817 [Dipteronia dyeriana]
MISLVSSSWLVVRDFNTVLGAHEALGSRSPTCGSCEDFRSMIEDCDLVGIHSYVSSADDIRDMVFVIDVASALKPVIKNPELRGTSQRCWDVKDDVMIFCKGAIKNLKNIMGSFKNYGDLSGQLVKWGKFFIYFGSPISPSWIGSFQSLIGIQIGQLPFCHLGVLLFQGKAQKMVLRLIADTILSKFVKWKGKSLSLAGRAILIMPVITGSFVHSFKIYR